MPAAAGFLVDERRLQVESEAAGQRLDRYLASRIPEFSRSRLQEWIHQGLVLVEGKPARPSHVLSPGQAVVLQVPPSPRSSLEPQPIPLNLLHSDEHLWVVSKPAGLQVHPGAGPPRPTLAHGLLHLDPRWEPPGPPDRPGILHRLDRDTSGLLLVARSHLAFQELGRQIRAHEVVRRYVALVWGSPETESGKCAGPIGRDPRDRRKMSVRPDGRPAFTEWRVLRRFEGLSLLEITLQTGRTHQIRVHLSSLGHPVFGDRTYGGGRSQLPRLSPRMGDQARAWLGRLSRQALHAYHLAFRHPASRDRLRFEAPVPPDIEAILLQLTEREATA